ncbi:phage tail protein [Shewanella sp. D64]|uniref:phage tail protein n=1 Tax=unclassified Shewanella TaxID=196818 RepID=UPI0022BA52A0|nr:MULTISPECIES: phage tail protein [unclassified Shewanella]MEC4724511.1 phage tail protein [Shewanella sp. D64]MEC4736712.1 phage tail protein [Shewanella sp. E94]WBJ94619.1 phage tail protein [Shewanella sp. MTB7]
MPPVIIGIAVGVAAAGAVSVGAAIAIGVAAAAFSYAMTPSVSAPSFSNEAYAQQQMLRSPAEARRGIYGRAMVSGPLIFVEESGNDNEYLHLVIALAGHQCDAIEEVYFGDDLAWTPATGMEGQYRNDAMVKAHLGDQTTADSTLVAQCLAWTDKHIGYGITYLYVRLKHNNEVFPNGVPNIKALVKGKRVYDPRLDSSAGGTGSHRFDDDSTWQWSENWALCVLDYTCFESGVGALPSEVDYVSYASAANDSDQQVEYQSEEFERRYCCNGTYNQDTSPASVLEKLLSAGAGMQVYVGGKYHLYAGVYQGPTVVTLNEDDCAGEIDVRPYTPRASLCNAVRGTFVDPDNFYQPTDFSPYESDYYRAQDNDEYIDHDIDLPFTQSNWTAQRLAKLHLEMNRAGMQVTFPCKMIGLSVSVGTVVQLQLPELGINGTFMVADWVFDYGKPVNLILRESTPAIFDFAMGSYTQRDLAANTYLPNPSNVPTVRNLMWQALGDDANWQGVLSWSAPGENSSYRYRLEVANTTGDLVYQANPDIPRDHIPKLDAGSYHISVWAVNMFANRSNVAAMLSIGASAPPPVVGIEVNAGPLELLLRPTTSTLIANTTEFEVMGSLSNDLNGAAVIGKGKEVIWPSRSPNTSHYIWARSINNFGHSAWFGPVLAQTSDDPTAILNLIENEIGARLGAYTWFAWADDNEGAGFTTDSTLSDGKAYMGVANEKSVATPSGNYQDYAWSRIAADIGSIFTPSEELALDNLMAGKLPGGSKDLLALQDALNNNSLSNDLLDANKLLNQGINADSLGGETPTGAQAKADAAKSSAISTAANDATTKANNAQSVAEANAALDALNKAAAAQGSAIAASVDIELVTTGAVVATGRSVARTGSYQGDWSSQAYSKESFTGGAVASCTIASGNAGAIRFMFGLNADPSSNASYNTLDYAFYPTNSLYYVYEGGLSKGMVLAVAPVVGDTLSVAYDGTQVKYFINGVVVRTVSAPVNLKLYMDSSFVNVAAGIRNINLQPLSNLNDARLSASTDASNKANSAQAAAETYALSKANLAEASASSYALSTLDSRLTLVESGQLKNSLSKSGLPHYQRLVVYGDSNRYYPVIIHGGDQYANRNIKIWRSYYEQGPDDWWIPTHKGSLMLHWEGNFGGWGGATYKSHLVQNASTYTTLLADLFHCNNNKSFCFMLRGGGPGGASYHFGSDQPLNATPYYNQDLYYDHSNNSYDSYAPASVTTLNLERLNAVLMGNITIQYLIGYAAQFAQLKSKMANFGGLTAETIAALAIATIHLQANAVTADKLQVDIALIQKLIADQGLFNQIQAQFGQFGGLAANAIAAKAITTEKLDVRARNLVNNFTATGETTGWSTKPLVNHVHKGQTVKAMQVITSGNYQGLSSYFDIDHTKIYEVNFSIYRKSGGATGTRYFGMHATGGPDGSVEYYNASTRSGGSSTTNFYFWSGDIATGATHQMRGYIVGSEVDIAAVPDSLNVWSICKLKPGTKQVRLRALNYYNAGVNTEDYWFNPSVTDVGGGIISANQFLANTGLFNTLKAKLASFGGLTANELSVDTALITKLVGTSALFNQLTAQLATFGGLTANAIAADAIEGRHFKASQLIESPIIQGGEFRLVGTGFMKVMRATPFGPDGLVEWYGPKLLTGTNPNYNALKKSNAITYLSANGDAYFGGTLSAGVFKNGGTVTVKTPYPSNSYPLTIGPFGTNGNSKTVVVSFYLSASYSSTSNSTNPAQPKLSWQLQRKIGSGGWSTISSGIFNGTTTVEYDQETNRYHSFEHLSGSSTTVDNNTSTNDFHYRIKVISQIRFHATQNIHNQNLTLLITEQ